MDLFVDERNEPYSTVLRYVVAHKFENSHDVEGMTARLLANQQDKEEQLRPCH